MTEPKRGRGRPPRPDIKPFREQQRAIFRDALLVLRARAVAGRKGEPVSFRSVIREAYRRASAGRTREECDALREECDAFLRRVATPEFRAWIAQNDTPTKLRTALRMNRAGRRRRFERGPDGDFILF